MKAYDQIKKFLVKPGVFVSWWKYFLATKAPGITSRSDSEGWALRITSDY
jgi:hypothetical protein